MRALSYDAWSSTYHTIKHLALGGPQSCCKLFIITFSIQYLLLKFHSTHIHHRYINVLIKQEIYVIAESLPNLLYKAVLLLAKQIRENVQLQITVITIIEKSSSIGLLQSARSTYLKLIMGQDHYLLDEIFNVLKLKLPVLTVFTIRMRKSFCDQKRIFPGVTVEMKLLKNIFLRNTL